MQPEQLTHELIALLPTLPSGQRYMLGITGGPAAGKSTLATALAASVNHHMGQEVAAIVPMDGFHLTNAALDALALRSLKGIPSTFDAAGFVRLLTRLRRVPADRVTAPAFDRTHDEPTADAIAILPQHRLVLVEGNYLLLPTPPWHLVRPLLDAVWYLDVTPDETHARLVERHIAGGRSAEAARQKVMSTDLPNAHLVAQSRWRADRRVRGWAKKPS
ncbi:MAG: nucleoside/nucleotide kinase family protein [Chloroflexaceae bacterium]|nr:nucleoside/nucleotide kinase family protein [Chloroflexaceae bacterium]